MASRRLLVVAMLLGGVVLAPAEAGLVSKQYTYKSGVILEIGVSTDDGLRLDNVRFQVPTKLSGQAARVGGLPSAEVAVSNGGDRGKKIGVSIALFDAEGRLVGTAGGGSRLISIKPGRQRSFTLVFDGVGDEADRATTFHIAVESK
jgi:hypothetical protein